MSQNEIVSKIEQLKEWEAMIEEATQALEALKDSIKEEMLKRDVEELECGSYIVRWTSVISNRFDSTSFKREYAKLYQEFTKPITSKRFSIS